jgi:hypothetical protein
LASRGQLGFGHVLKMRSEIYRDRLSMPTVVASFTDCRSFWREIVVPDYNDFAAKIGDLRRAFHCAISLFHLSDWVYVAHGTSIDANFTFGDKKGVVRPVTDEKTFANALGDLASRF